MSEWSDIVTTALLGTDRRPSPRLEQAWGQGSYARDPAVRVLELAALHRAVGVSGATTGEDWPTEVGAGPDQRHPVAPPQAVEVLDALLGRPDQTLIGTWLQTCVEHRRTAAPVHWTPLARLAARSATGYDRATLGRALGECGRWFLRQNPDWRRLAADTEAGASAAAPLASTGATRAALPGRLLADQLPRHPDLLFDQPDPWSAELVAAAYALVGTLALGTRTRAYAGQLGARLPVVLYAGLPAAAGFYLLEPEATPAQRRAVRDAFNALEQAAALRAGIASAFGGSESAFVRVEMPGV